MQRPARRKSPIDSDEFVAEDISARIKIIATAKNPRQVVNAIGTEKRLLNESFSSEEPESLQQEFLSLKVEGEKLIRESTSEVQIYLDSLVLKPLKSKLLNRRLFVKRFALFDQEMNPMNVRKAKFEYHKLRNSARGNQTGTRPPDLRTIGGLSKRKISAGTPRLRSLKTAKAPPRPTKNDIDIAFSSSDSGDVRSPPRQKKRPRVSLVGLMRGNTVHQEKEPEYEYEYDEDEVEVEEEEEILEQPPERRPSVTFSYGSQKSGKWQATYESDVEEESQTENTSAGSESESETEEFQVEETKETPLPVENEPQEMEMEKFESDHEESYHESDHEEALQESEHIHEEEEEEKLEEDRNVETIDLARTERKSRSMNKESDDLCRLMFYDPECQIPDFFSPHDVFSKGRSPKTASSNLKWSSGNQQTPIVESYVPSIPEAALAEHEEQKIIISRDTIAPNSVFLEKLQNKALQSTYQKVTDDARNARIDRLTVFMASDAIAIPISNHQSEVELPDPDGIERVEKMFSPMSEFEKSDIDYTIFLLPRLLPLPLFPDLRDKMEMLDADRRDAFLRVYCESYITPDVVPLAQDKIDMIAVYGGVLGRKRGLRKTVRRQATLYLTGELWFGDEVIKLEGLVAKLSSRKSKFTLTKNKKTRFTFRTASPEEALNWARNINELLQGSSRLLLDLFLFAYASPMKYSTTKELVLSALSSPDVSLVVSLLTNDKFSLTLVGQIFQVFLSVKRIDYLIRCLLLSELTTTDFNHAFAVKSVYSTSLLVLFVGAAQEWIRQFARSFLENGIETAEDMIELTMLAFNAIPPRSLFIIRALLLITAIRVPSDSHPLLPFFNFIMASIRPFVIQIDSEKKVRHHNVWLQLLDILTSRDQFKSKYILMLSPFMLRIIRSVPVLKDCPLGGVDFQQIYAFMNDNCSAINKSLREIHDREPRDHPLTHSYYQNLRFLMKDICPLDV